MNVNWVTTILHAAREKVTRRPTLRMKLLYTETADFVPRERRVAFASGSLGVWEIWRGAGLLSLSRSDGRRTETRRVLWECEIMRLCHFGNAPTKKVLKSTPPTCYQRRVAKRQRNAEFFGNSDSSDAPLTLRFSNTKITKSTKITNFSLCPLWQIPLPYQLSKTLCVLRAFAPLR